MRICIICPIFHSAKYRTKKRWDIFEVSKRLQERGHQIFVVTAKVFGAPSREEIARIKIFRYPAFTVPKIRYFIPHLPSLIRIVNGIIQTYGIDVFHFWNYEYLASATLPLLKSMFKKPVIITLVDIPGVSWFYGNKIVDLFGRIYTETLGKMILSSADKIIVFGKKIYRNVSGIGVRPEKIEIIPNAVDTGIFNPSNIKEGMKLSLGMGPEDIMVVSVTRLVSVKGIEYLILAASELVKIFPSLKVVIVGGGPLRNKYEEMVKSAGIEDKVIFTGIRSDIPSILNSSDIFALPSLSEGLPLSLIEACACAKPVVATDVGCISDLIINNKTGLLIQPRNVRQLIRAFHYLLSNFDDAQKMGLKARKLVLEKYNWKNIVEKYEGVYRSVL